MTEIEILNVLITKKVDLHLVSWAAPSCKAYNIHIKESWHKDICKELTEEEFAAICEYGQKMLNDGGSYR